MTPLQSHQIHSITFRGVNPGFGTVCVASPFLYHDLFRTLLSYLIHFSSPVTNRFRNGSISLRISKESQMLILSNKFFTDNSCGIQTSSFFCSHPFLNGSKPFDIEDLVPWRCHGCFCDDPGLSFQ